MNIILKDRVVLLCLALMAISGALLLKRWMIFSRASRAVAASEQKQIHALKDEVQKLASEVKQLRQGGQQAEAPVAKVETPAIPVARPKQNGLWIIGTGADADTPQLKFALENAMEGDIFQLSPGFHNLDLSVAKISKISIDAPSRAGVVYLHSDKIPKLDSIHLKNIDLTFSDHTLDFVGLGKQGTKIAIESSTIKHPKLTLSFRDESELMLNGVELSGVALRFSGNSKLKMQGSSMEKTSTCITLADESVADINGSRFKDYTNVAVTSDSDRVTLTADKLHVSGGLYAFWGKFNKANARIKESRFHGLQEFTLTGTTVTCNTCEKYDIKR